jgi:Smg protein
LHTAAQNAETIQIDAPKTAWETAYVQSPDSMRVYSVAEQQQLGSAGLGFITFMEGAGVLPPQCEKSWWTAPWQ